MTEKSILEQALLQVQNLEEAVKQNAKGILASTMKEELKDLLKESLEEEEKVEASEEVSMEPKEEEEKDMSEQPADDEEADDDSEDEGNLDNEPSKDIESLDSEVGGDEMGDDESMDDESMGSEDSLELPSDDMGMDDEDVMDMTSASDEEVLKVFKAMKPEDGIVVKKDGNNVELEAGDDEYIIKLDGEDSDLDEDWNMEEEVSEEKEESKEEEAKEEETIYEIEMDEEEEAKEEVSEEEESKEEETKEEESKEVEATEAARTFANDVRVPANQGKKFKAGRHEMNEEVENLKKQNAEYKKALILFKEKLNEVAVFNANLAYATRLFTEHTTTKQEKLNILKRFDSVSTMNESKNLFEAIKAELGTKTTVTETVAEKISNTPQTSSSTEVLSESKAYENPQFSRIKEMMRKIK